MIYRMLCSDTRKKVRLGRWSVDRDATMSTPVRYVCSRVVLRSFVHDGPKKALERWWPVPSWLRRRTCNRLQSAGLCFHPGFTP